MGQPVITVDAFADRPFAGNPAAVCVLPAARDEAWMQQVAAEMNLSETAFLVRRDDGDYDLRWFTPGAEVPLCGHATLGSAHVLWETGALEATATARFHTKSGLLTATRQGEWIEMDFPAIIPTPTEIPPTLRDALGVELITVGHGGSDGKYLVELADEATVRAVTPDFPAIAALPTQGVIITSRANTPGYDFVSRYFAPKIGINEDPVTGSAHSYLTPFWAAKLGRDELVGYQASARGGVVRVRRVGDRVRLSGQAVTVLRGELAL